jgi:hypothetical protein
MIRIAFTPPIRGGQLLREIAAATGITLTSDDLIAYDDNTLAINAPESTRVAIQAVIAAHVPTSRKTVVDLARARVNALAGIAAKDLTASQVRDLLLGMACQIGALDNTGKVLPFDNWGDL